MGPVWWDDYFGYLKSLGLDHDVQYQTVSEVTFGFVDGAVSDSVTLVTFAVAVAKVPHFASAYLLDIPGLNLLLGRDYIESVHAEIKTTTPRMMKGMPGRRAFAPPPPQTHRVK